jgi:hypothetical protein
MNNARYLVTASPLLELLPFGHADELLHMGRHKDLWSRQPYSSTRMLKRQEAFWAARPYFH